MPDSLATMLASINDGGANTAAEMRAVIEALYQWTKKNSPVGDDVHWDGNDLAGFSTPILPSGSHTLTEANGLLSVHYNGQSTADLAGILKPLTGFAIGDSIQTAVRMMTTGANWAMAALILADGDLASSNAIMAFYEVGGSGANEIVTRTGSMGTVGADIQIETAVMDGRSIFGALHMRLLWVSANTFRLEISPDGVNWDAFTMADSARTLTPTHGGIGWSVWGGAGVRINTFEYFKVNL